MFCEVNVNKLEVVRLVRELGLKLSPNLYPAVLWFAVLTSGASLALK